MARYDVTPELASTIKSVRIQNHVASKAVAEHIGKSQSYMSKLEKGDIKTIEEAELSSIFHFIFGNDKDFQEFLDSYLNKILDTLELRYSDEDIEKQLWFMNYDTVLRLIPVPSELVDDLCRRINALNISVKSLVDVVNSNDSISPKVKNTDAYPFNEWQAFVVNHKIEFQFIKIKLDSSEIQKILTKEKLSTNYVSIQSLAFYLFKIEKYGSSCTLSDEEDQRLMSYTTDYLNSYKFYSILEINKLKKHVSSKAELDSLLSSFDKENSSLIKQIIDIIDFISQVDILEMNKQLSGFLKNLEWDSNFIMALLNSNFYELEDLSYTVKKELLSEIRALLSKYKDLPDNKRKLDKYE